MAQGEQGVAAAPPIVVDCGVRRIAATAAVLLLVVLGLAWWQSSALAALYGAHQVGRTGWLLNGLVLALFLVGLVRLVQLLVALLREEQALRAALALLPGNGDLPAGSLPAGSLIAERVAALDHLHATGQPIRHEVLAATLVARQSGRMNLPRFVNSSLILCGVFGTIVSLSMVLVGASDLLNTVNSSGMGLVIHGMSTALSTTMTAILCYLYFTWLMHSVADAETRLLAALEETTIHWLLPRYHVDAQTINHQLAELLLAMGGLVERMEQAADAQPRLLEAIADQQRQAEGRHARLVAELERIAGVLRRGFRLPGPEAE
ncbi:MAG: hypothetical protein D6682_08345 [Zetaproteobacteria bacterium]|nr:MAG: hypothetical protein D6682_08345 [Zetaproteobacteria bacterium]